MIDREPKAGGAKMVGAGASIPEAVPERYRQRAVARRRRSSKPRHDKPWVIRSRRRHVRTFVVCASVLLLMAVGLYFGLAHQEAAPGDDALRAAPSLLALGA